MRPETGPTGLLEAGNIDLTNRPAVKNADGTISSVRTIGIGTDRGEVVIPTVHDDGYILSDEEAIEHYRKTARHFGIFSDVDAATAFADQLHLDQAAMTKPKKVEEPPAPRRRSNYATKLVDDIDAAVSARKDRDIWRQKYRERKKREYVEKFRADMASPSGKAPVGGKPRITNPFPVTEESIEAERKADALLRMRRR